MLLRFVLIFGLASAQFNPSDLLAKIQNMDRTTVDEISSLLKPLLLNEAVQKFTIVDALNIISDFSEGKISNFILQILI